MAHGVTSKHTYLLDVLALCPDEGTFWPWLMVSMAD